MAAFNKKTGQIEVSCAEDTQVSIGKLKQMNKKLMTAKEWWIGIPERRKEADGTIKFHGGENGIMDGLVADVLIGVADAAWTVGRR
jgi:hypothetical protein